MKLYSGTIQSLENGLNYSAVRNKVITQNINNAETPNYKAKEVSFKQVLDEQLSVDAYRTDQRHFNFSTKASTFSVYSQPNQVYNNNLNNVQIDKEMATLAENQIYYNALIDRIGSKFNSLKTVIKGGR